MSDALEVEIKLSFPDVGTARRALLAAGAVEARPRHFEENLVFDTPSGDLAASSRLLRVRATSDGQGALTYKEKVASEATAKVRRELETTVSAPAVLAAILERAGYVVTYRYEKYRTVFTLDGATIDLDETPMGCFVEIEAPAAAIPGLAARLGASERDFIVDDYRTVFREWLGARGRPLTDMTFAAVAGSAP
ncbi:MAG: class IV adenylate cyclase [Acidobacteria bacterium]|nr:class IV adenylate cyclase [Acidobacteriota bacterium]